MTQANPQRAKIIETIRRCMSLGSNGSGTTQHEAETAMMMARKLMDKHNLSMSDVDFKKEVETGAKEVKVKHSRFQFDAYEKMLAGLVDLIFDTEHFYRYGGIDKAQIVFVGVGLDPEVAGESYSILLEAIRKMGAETGLAGASRRHYMMGVITGCKGRVKEEKRRAAQESVKCRDMIITKDQLIKAQIDSHGLKAGRPLQIRPGQKEFNAGLIDSNRVNLSFRKSLKGGPQA